MSAPLSLWWNERTTREQRLLLAMFALLGITIAWVIILTVENAATAARTRHTAAVIAHAETAARVEALRQYRQPAVLPAPIESVIGSAATEAGFVLARNEGQAGGRVLISIASARPQAFFGWINALESRGIFPEKLTARANSDRTLTVEATFRARGSQ